MTTEAPGHVITYAKAEFINIDGSVIGFGRIRFMDRMIRQAIKDTVGGVGTELEVSLPATERGDPRCPYRLRLILE